MQIKLNYPLLFVQMGSEAPTKHYSTPVESSKEPGFSHIYRNPKTMKGLFSTPDPKIRTMKDVIEATVQRYGDQDFCGNIMLRPTQNNGETVEERELKMHTYREIYQQAENLGSYLQEHKMYYEEPVQKMKLVGIFAKNRYEWVVADIACILYGMTIIPLYDTLGIQNLTYCLEHSEIETCFVTALTIKTLLNLKGHGKLKNIICFDELTPEIEKDLQKHDFRVTHYSELTKKQKNFVPHKGVKITERDCITFSYTSGTTGPPKGAMLSHGNFISFLAAFKTHELGGMRHDDSYVSFLPLPHVMERVVVAALIEGGSKIAFYNGDVTKIKDDLAFFKPTIFIAVPRLFNRIVEAIQAKIAQTTGIKGCLINSGYNSKLEHLHKSGEYTSGFYDAVVFSKIREGFGGRVRFMLTGSAPIKPEVYEFMKIVMCCPFYEGYGQTENTAAAFIRDAIDPVNGHVGGITNNLEFKLQDIPEMHYTSEDKDANGKPSPRGQIWMRGPAVFLGYYKDKEKTAETLTPDGWLKSGDVGMIMPDTNAMKIIDRKKNIFKLQQGEYVASEKVEGIYSKSHLISEVFLHGESLHNFAVAVVTVNKDELLKLAEKNNIKGSYEELCRKREVRILVCKELDSFGKQNGLMSFEQAKNVYIEPTTFADQNILTNTFKLQRFQAKKRYAKEIEAMYQEDMLPLK